MKNFFYYVLTLFAAITLSTSCGVNEEENPVLQSFATITETPAGSRVPYAVTFDDGKTAFVNNANQWNPTFGPNVRELRFLVTYEITNQQSVGYDYEITIIGVKECMPTQSYLRVVTAENFTGVDGLQNYDDGASVDACFLSNHNDWLTLSVTYNVDQFKMTTAPDMVLVQNSNPESSPFKSLYKDDNYFYLELYHNDSQYTGNSQYATNLSCKFTVQGGIKSLMQNYKGIKILSFNHTTTLPYEKAFDFATEEQQ